MARPLALSNLAPCELRSIAGVIAADSATLTDANFPVASGVCCAGFDTILVGVEITAGTSPTATIEALFRDNDAPDGSRWKRLLLGARDGITAVGTPAAEDTGALAQNSDFVELRVYGAQLVFLRVKAVGSAGSTTNLKILAMPGRPRNMAGYQR